MSDLPPIVYQPVSTSSSIPARETSELESQVESRFGVLPNFFRLGSETPEITKNLWGFAQVAYLDNPLPSLFKERLFVQLSRFCEIRYCIARHVGFLLGLGRPSGDSQAPVLTAEEVVHLIQRSFPRGEQLKPFIRLCANTGLLTELPSTGSEMERALFVLSCHVFLQSSDALACLSTLKEVLGGVRLEYLNLLLAFVRTAHYWTKIHPELTLEDDIKQLLATHKALADCVLRDPEAGINEVADKLVTELTSLREKGLQDERLRELSNRLVQVQDQERRRLARELHDSTGQVLSLLNMNLSQLSKRIPLGNADLRQSVDICTSLTAEMTSQLRTVSYLLHPPLLDEIGLAAAIRWLLDGFQERSHISVSVDIAEDFPRLPQDLEIALYRIVQESLANVHRHSGSNTASLRICNNGETVCLEISDEGKGIPAELLAGIQAKRSGVGMAAMRERVHPFKGDLDIQSSAAGTMIRVTVPTVHFGSDPRDVAASGG